MTLLVRDNWFRGKPRQDTAQCPEVMIAGEHRIGDKFIQG
jgi:hypothetical protein